MEIMIKDNDDKVGKLSKPEINAFATVEKILTKIKKFASPKTDVRILADATLSNFQKILPYIKSQIELTKSTNPPKEG